MDTNDFNGRAHGIQSTDQGAVKARFSAYICEDITEAADKDNAVRQAIVRELQRSSEEEGKKRFPGLEERHLTKPYVLDNANPGACYSAQIFEDPETGKTILFVKSTGDVVGIVDEHCGKTQYRNWFNCKGMTVNENGGEVISLFGSNPSSSVWPSF